MFLLVVLAIIIIIFFIEKHSIDNALNGIEYKQYSSLTVVEPDEEFEIISILQNRTRRFVGFLRLYEKFSKEVSVKVESAITKDNTILETTQFLMPKQKLERRMKASISQRGRYFLYGATIEEGDFLGVSETSGDYSCIEEVVVIPKETTIPDLDIKLSGLIGDVSINRFIFEDPILTAGFNDYTGQEPQKMISWTQSARVGHLMVKKYDYTLELLVTVILNIDYDGTDYVENLEECFSIARSVCQYLEAKNIKYKFITNAAIAGARPVWANSSDGWGSNFLMDILEGLGRAVHMNTETFENTLDRALDYAELGRGYIIITPEMSENHIYAKQLLRDITGIDVCVLTSKQGGEQDVFSFSN